MDSTAANTMPQFTEWKGENMDEDDDFAGDLKIRINTMLWEILPGKCTMEDAEKLSIKIWEDILKVREDTQK